MILVSNNVMNNNFASFKIFLALELSSGSVKIPCTNDDKLPIKVLYRARVTLFFP